MGRDFRWPLVVALVVGLLVVAWGCFAVGRATAPDNSASAPPLVTPAAVRTINGVQVGVLRTRAGALAAADNYAARSAETAIGDPSAFTRLIRTAWQPSARARPLAEAARARKLAPDAVANYAAGGRGIAITAARKLESYDGTHASVLSWGGGFVWGPGTPPAQRWYLDRTRLVWARGAWRVESLDELPDRAPTPYRVAVQGRGADSTQVFDEKLAGMSAPIYGTPGDTP